MITDPVVLNPIKEPKYFKTVKVAQGARQEIVFQLTDTNGSALNLSDKETVKADKCQEDGDGLDAQNPGFPDGIRPKGPWPDASIRMVVSPGYGEEPLFTVTGEVIDFVEGKVIFHLTDKELGVAGLYMGEIGLFRGELLQNRWPLYLNIEQSLFARTQPGSRKGVISIAEVRLFMRDLDASFNDVLEELEFKDVEIAACIRRPVDVWNELLPFEPTLQYKYAAFPFRDAWIRATTGYLLELASHWYRRNDLSVSAAGVQVSDRDKHRTYEPKSMQLIQEYQAWAKQTKAALSARLAFGSMQSTFPRSNMWR